MKYMDVYIYSIRRSIVFEAVGGDFQKKDRKREEYHIQKDGRTGRARQRFHQVYFLILYCLIFGKGSTITETPLLWLFFLYFFVLLFLFSFCFPNLLIVLKETHSASGEIYHLASSIVLFSFLFFSISLLLNMYMYLYNRPVVFFIQHQRDS